jgi:excinuclease ABC subunit B
LQTPGKKYAEPAANDRMVAEGEADETVADVIAELEAEMLEAARKLQFEKAANLRDQLEALQAGTDATGRRQQPAVKVKKKRKSVYNKKGLPRQR